MIRRTVPAEEPADHDITLINVLVLIVGITYFTSFFLPFWIYTPFWGMMDRRRP